MHCYFVLEALRVHELRGTFQVAQGLIVVLSLTMDGCSQQKQLGHIVEQFKSLRDELQSQVPVALEDGSRRLLVKLFSTRLLDGEELDDLVVVRVDRVCRPEHLIALVYLINAPQ